MYSTTSPNPMTRRRPTVCVLLVAVCSDGCMDTCPPGWRRTAAGVYARPGRDAREDGRSDHGTVYTPAVARRAGRLSRTRTHEPARLPPAFGPVTPRHLTT